MARLIIIGIDSLDNAVIDAFEDELPTLAKLRKEGHNIPTVSTYPTDSPTAWASLLSGLSPAEHGKFYFVRPERGESSLSPEELEAMTDLRGKMFWDTLSAEGFRMSILFPLSVYPAWPIHGTFCARTMSRDEKNRPVMVIPPEEAPAGFDLERLQTMKTYPRDLDSSLAKATALAQAEREFSMRMFEKGGWDVFFSYFSIVDWAGHTFWDHHEEFLRTGDRTKRNATALLDMYRLHDTIIGEYYAKLESDDVLVVVSDHGHGMRPTKLVNINEWLRQQGYLNLVTTNAGDKAVRNARNGLKNVAVKVLSRTRIGISWAGKFFARYPKLRKFYTSSPLIDYTKSKAYVTDRSGIKAYTFAGIHVNRDAFADEVAYEQAVDHLIAGLKELKVPGDDRPVVMWACRREELYKGPFVDRFPQIVFDLRSEYGAGWRVKGPILEMAQTQALQAGTHRSDTGVFYVQRKTGNPAITVPEPPIQLYQIHPVLLELARTCCRPSEAKKKV